MQNEISWGDDDFSSLGESSTRIQTMSIRQLKTRYEDFLKKEVGEHNFNELRNFVNDSFISVVKKINSAIEKSIKQSTVITVNYRTQWFECQYRKDDICIDCTKIIISKIINHYRACGYDAYYDSDGYVRVSVVVDVF